MRLHEGNLGDKIVPGVGYPITFCHTKTADNLVRYLSQKTRDELVEWIESDVVHSAPKGQCKFCGETVRWFFPALSESNNPALRGKGPGHMSYSTLYRRFKQIAVHAKITRRVHPHLLRATRVTDIRTKATEQKKDGLAMVRNLVGIKGDKIIELYTRPKGRNDKWKADAAAMGLPELE